MKQSEAMLKTLATGTLAALGVALAAVLARPATVHAETKNIVETAVASGSFKTLAKALEAADLVGTLSGPGPFTVFAPTDEAVAKLPAGTLESLLEPANKEKLRRVLTYHVVAGKVPASEVVKLDGKSAKTVNGASVASAIKGSDVYLNGDTKVVQADIAASNGVIHVIDKVLLPPAM